MNRKWSVTPRLAAGNYADPYCYPYQLDNARECKFSCVFRSPAWLERVYACIYARQHVGRMKRKK